MGDLRYLWPTGAPLDDADLQGQAAHAATMDERVYESLMTQIGGGILKQVVPLVDEVTGFAATIPVNPRLLVFPSVTNGKARLLPALFIVWSDARTVAMSASSGTTAAADSALIGSNSSGTTRHDLLYATIARSPSTSVQRVMKDINADTESQQNVVLTDIPTVTLTVLPGNNALPSLPADGGGAYNFALADIAVANGFVQGNAITQAMITQLWPGGGIPADKILNLRLASIMSAGISHTGTTASKWFPSSGVGQRFAGVSHLEFVFKHVAADNPGPVTFIVDNSIDWRMRTIKIEGYRGQTVAGAYPGPEGQTAGGNVAGNYANFNTGKWGTGNDAGQYVISNILGSANVQLAFFADNTTGALKAVISGAHNPLDAANGDNWSCTATLFGGQYSF